MNKTEDEWKEELTSEQYEVLRNKGTERPFSGKYYKEKGTGIYKCAACGQELFSSKAKYDSGCGWPSFYKSIADDSVDMQEDHSLSMVRTEVTCPKCGSHLGHVFDDGPDPTGKRYCINSVSLKMDKNEEDGKEDE